LKPVIFHHVGSNPPAQQTTPRNVYAFGLTSLFNDTATEMAYWVLPAFIASLGAGAAQLGIIEGIAESVASFVKLFSGYLADRVDRRKPLVVGGYLAANAVKPLLALVTSWWQVLGIRFVDRFAKGVRGTSADVMVAESVDKSKLGSAYGLIQAMDSAGAIAGPLLALALIGHFGMRGVFAAAAVPGALCVLAAWVGIREVGREKPGFRFSALGSRDSRSAKGEESPLESGPGERTSKVESISQAQPLANGRESKAARNEARGESREPKAALHLPFGFYYVLVVVTLFSLGNSSDMFLVLRAGNVGIPASQSPLLGLVFNVMFTLFSWPAGKVSDHFSRSTIAAAGYGVFAIVYFVFARAPSRRAIWLTMAFYGLFYALTNPVLKALVVETVGSDVRGRALGIYYFTSSIAVLFASIITGALWKAYGAPVPFYLSAGIAAVSAIALLAHQRIESLKH
jgi:MFS family permease